MRVPKRNGDLPENPPAKPRRAARKRGQYGILLTILFSVIAIALYYACTIRPEKLWMAGFAGFLIPPAILGLVLLLIYWLFIRPIAALIPAFALFLGLRFIQASFGWHFLILEKCGDFKILSLNARTFGAMENPKPIISDKTSETVEAIIQTKADVICIQEMYDFPGVAPYNTVKKLKKAGYKHVFYSIARKNWGSSVGLAIFSRHPITSQQVIRKKEGSNNQIILARIRIGERHVSVINMHLQSVAIKDSDLSKPDETQEALHQSMTIGKKLKKGFQIRAKQIDDLLQAARNEGDYLVICGDLNDTPYSNAYLRLKDEYQNSFEEKGRGFGFTFNGPVPFLRIDQQFFAKGLKVNRFDVNRKFPSSDHFGTEACYSFAE